MKTRPNATRQRRIKISSDEEDEVVEERSAQSGLAKSAVMHEIRSPSTPHHHRRQLTTSIGNQESNVNSVKEKVSSPPLPHQRRQRKRLHHRTDEDQDDEDDFIVHDAVSDIEDEEGHKSPEKSTLSIGIVTVPPLSLPLKPDHASRPFWVTPAHRILLEAFSPIAKPTMDFLTAIAEPITRPHHIHEYQLTPYSLYAAISVGLDTPSILRMLEALSKTTLPASVISFVTECTAKVGKVRLVLQQGQKYQVEVRQDGEGIWSSIAEDAEMSGLMQKATSPLVDRGGVDLDAEASLLAGPSISQENAAFPMMKESFEGIDLFDLFNDDDAYSLPDENDPAHAKSSIPFNADILEEEEDRDEPLWSNRKGSNAATMTDNTTSMDANYAQLANQLAALDQKQQDLSRQENPVQSFSLKPGAIEPFRAACSRLSIPVMEEYDFKADMGNPDVPMGLKPSTRLRDYQEVALSKLFGNGRARSGIVVLPCGSGKTLVGVAAACTIKKSCLVLCTSNVSAEQWTREFLRFSTLDKANIAKFSSESKEIFTGPAGILVTTYTMATYSGKRAYDAQQVMDFIQSREWGLILLDEVHVVPADMFRRVLTIASAHCKLGLTATLVREDEKIANLNYLIGPKLYEANWQQLAQQGHIANVQCSSVWCRMPREFYREYLNARDSRLQTLLAVMNPFKLQATQYLIQYHEAKGDKIIVFSDSVFALKYFATRLGKPCIYGSTSTSERLRILQQFRYNPALNTIFLSKVGDTSLDVPEANVLIQISSHFGSRRQEAQRLGRILRGKKTGRPGECNAHFYTLLSRDTSEMGFAQRRRLFLMDQGYAFQVVTSLPEEELDRRETISLLTTVMSESSVTLALRGPKKQSSRKRGADKSRLKGKSKAEPDWAGSDEDDVMIIDDADEDVVEVDVGKSRPRQGSTERGPTTTSTTNHSLLSSISGLDSMAYLEYSPSL